MSAVLIPVADALTAALNGHVFSQPVTWERTYADWDLPLEKISDLRGDVVPVQDPKCELETRGSLVYSPAIDLVLRRKFAGEHLEQVPGVEEHRLKKADIDPLVALVEEVNEWLATRELPTYADAVWQAPTIVAAVVHKHLRLYQQFTGVIRIGYSVSKDLP